MESGQAPQGADLIERLRDEERSLSARRVRLQDRIDFLRTGGGGDTPESANLLAELERRERQISQLRRELHRQIDVLSAQVLGPS